MISHSRKFRKRPSSIFPLFLGLTLLLLLGFLAVSNWKINKKRSELNSGLEIFSKKIKNLESINQSLAEKLSAIPEESYLEKVAREKFNLRKPGEQVVVIKKEKGNATSAEIEVQKNFFNPKNWLEWVKSKLRD
jgi:cell division protein FtsB